MDAFLKNNLETFLDRTHRIFFRDESFNFELINDPFNIGNEECSKIDRGHLSKNFKIYQLLIYYVFRSNLLADKSNHGC